MVKVKRLITPLFFIIITIVVLSCSSYAISGVPTISINGGSNTPLISSVTFEDGDEVVVNGTGVISFLLDVPSGVKFTVNPNVTLESSNFITVHGVLNNYGTISSTQYYIENYGIINQYFGSVTRATNGNAIIQNQNSILNIYGGEIISPTTAVSNDTGTVNFYDGTVDGNTASFTDLNNINVVNGTLDVDNGTATVKPNILGSITDFVSVSISWISSFVSAITSNSILLVFVLVVFTGLGIGLLRRVKSI